MLPFIKVLFNDERMILAGQKVINHDQTQLGVGRGSSAAKKFSTGGLKGQLLQSYNLICVFMRKFTFFNKFLLKFEKI